MNEDERIAMSVRRPSIPLCELPEPWEDHLPEPDDAYELLIFGVEPREPGDNER